MYSQQTFQIRVHLQRVNYVERTYSRGLSQSIVQTEVKVSEK